MAAGDPIAEKDLTAATTLDNDDYIRVLRDVLGVLESQIISYPNFKTVLKAYTDTLYSPIGAGGGSNSICDGRLTLATGVPVTTTDQTAKTTIYFTPYIGNKIALYDGASAWNVISFTEISVAVPSTTNTPFDIFCYNNSGTATLETVNWTNDTTRATALTYQNGVLVKNGATTRRYLGTGRTTGSSGQTEISFGRTPASGGSAPKLYLYNEYNKVPAVFMSLESDDFWNYTTGSWRSKNNNTNNSFKFVNGNKMTISCNMTYGVYMTSGTAFLYAGFGFDSTTAADGIPNRCIADTVGAKFFSCFGGYNAAVGYHYIQELELGAANAQFAGDAGAPANTQTGSVYMTEM